MRVKVLDLGSTEAVFTKGTIQPGSSLVTIKNKKKKIVTKIWNVRRGLTGRKIIPLVVAMDGEPRTLDYMDTFDSEAFEAFLKDALVDLKDNGKQVDEILKRIHAWTGPDNQIADIEGRPYLDRKFRASPVTDKHLHRAITDEQRTRLMRGPKMDPIILFAILAIVAFIVLGLIIYSLVSRPIIIGDGSGEPPFEVVETIRLKIWMWWYG